jgi:hypothetical protein
VAAGADPGWSADAGATQVAVNTTGAGLATADDHLDDHIVALTAAAHAVFA